MPKVSTSTRGKKRSKDHGHQYHEAAKVRKLRKSRFKEIFEVVKPVESGRPGPSPKVNMNWFGGESFGHKMPVYAANFVNLNMPRRVVTGIRRISEATAK